MALLEIAQLERPFKEEEIWEAINSAGNNKSPWPDGFTSKFFKFSKNILKQDIMEVFENSTKIRIWVEEQTVFISNFDPEKGKERPTKRL